MKVNEASEKRTSLPLEHIGAPDFVTRQLHDARDCTMENRRVGRLVRPDHGARDARLRHHSEFQLRNESCLRGSTPECSQRWLRVRLGASAISSRFAGIRCPLVRDRKGDTGYV